MNARAMHEGEGERTLVLGDANRKQAQQNILGPCMLCLGEDGTKLTLCDARGKQLATIRRRCNYGQHQSPLPPSLAKCLWSSL